MPPDRLQQALEIAARPEVVAWLRLGFLVGLALCAVFALVSKRRPGKPTGVLPGRGTTAVLCLSVASILAYQSTWQLAGFTRPRFLHFMRHFDRRPRRAADAFRRGRILDRNGLVIATDSDDVPATRLYTMGAAGAHLVGYDSPIYGKTGLENTFDSLLSGREPASREQFSRLYRNLVDHDNASGFDLRLTLDSRLQQVAYAVLNERAGACIILDPRNGAVLTVVSSPSFDPEELAMESLRTRVDAPLFNRALKGRYPPGSSIRPLIAAAALEAGLDPVWDCPTNGFRPPHAPAPIRDHEFYERERRGRPWQGRQNVDLDTALVRSSNVYFARLGVETGYQAFNRITAAARFNQDIALTQLPGGPYADASLAPRLVAGNDAELAQCSIGQGLMLTTPLQMAMVGAAIAMDGKLYAPRLILGEPTTVLGQVMSVTTSRRLRQALRETVRVGTARRADLATIDVAGKTGTAQAATGADHAWFVAMAPADNPRIVIAIVLEHAGFASQSAVPMAAEVLRAAVRFGIVGSPPTTEGRP